MKLQKLKISGAYLIKPKPFIDSRGFLEEIFVKMNENFHEK